MPFLAFLWLEGKARFAITFRKHRRKLTMLPMLELSIATTLSVASSHFYTTWGMSPSGAITPRREESLACLEIKESSSVKSCSRSDAPSFLYHWYVSSVHSLELYLGQNPK